MKILQLPKVLITIFFLLSSASTYANESGWTKVDNVKINISSVVTLVLEADILTECLGLISFTYDEATLSKHFYTLLVASKVSNLDINVTYSDLGATCSLTGIDIKPPAPAP